MDSLKKEEIIKEAKNGYLERVLEYLDLTKEEQFITNEERDFLYWAALTNYFSNNLTNFEECKKKGDYFGLVDTINSLIDTFEQMEAFVKQDANGYFSAEDDDLEGEKDEEEKINLKQIIDEGDYSLMEQDMLNYQGVKKIVDVRRYKLISVLSEFILLTKDITYEITVPNRKKDFYLN